MPPPRARAAALLAVVLTGAAGPLAPAQETLDFAALAALYGGRLDQSPGARERRERLAAARASERAALAEAPLSLSERASRSDELPVGGYSDSRWAKTHALSSDVAYRDRAGTDASLTARTEYREVEHERVPTPFGPVHAETKSKQHSLELRLARDVVKGGRGGAAELRARSEGADARRRALDVSVEELASRRRFHDGLVDLYSATCALRTLRGAATAVAATTRVAAEKAEARLIPEKDLLNFRDLEASFTLRVAAKELERQRVLTAFAESGAELAAELGAVDEARFACGETAAASLAAVRAALALGDEALAQAPATRSAEAAQTAARLQLEAARIDRRPSVAPFVSGVYRLTPDAASRDGGSVELGVSLDWTLPSDKSSFSDRAAAAGVRAAGEALARARTALAVEVRDAAVTVEAQARTLPILDARVRNARRLIDALEAQLAARIVDSLGLANARLGLLDAELALIDAWSVLAKTEFRLRQLQGSAGD